MLNKFLRIALHIKVLRRFLVILAIITFVVISRTNVSTVAWGEL